jgi:hypothetical protein
VPTQTQTPPHVVLVSSNKGQSEKEREIAGKRGRRLGKAVKSGSKVTECKIK